MVNKKQLSGIIFHILDDLCPNGASREFIFDACMLGFTDDPYLVRTKENIAMHHVFGVLTSLCRSKKISSCRKNGTIFYLSNKVAEEQQKLQKEKSQPKENPIFDTIVNFFRKKKTESN